MCDSPSWRRPRGRYAVYVEADRSAVIRNLLQRGGPYVEHDHRVERRPPTLATRAAAQCRNERSAGKLQSRPLPLVAPADRAPRSEPRTGPEDQRNRAAQQSLPPLPCHGSESAQALRRHRFRGVQLPQASLAGEGRGLASLEKCAERSMLAAQRQTAPDPRLLSFRKEV